MVTDYERPLGKRLAAVAETAENVPDIHGDRRVQRLHDQIRSGHISLFMAFFFVTTAASTIFYDQENHGFLYLFTLPTRKKDYVIQKQLLILASSLVAVGLSLVLIFLMMQFDPELQASAEELLYTALYRFLFRLPLRCHHHPVVPEIRNRKSPNAFVCDHGRIRAGRDPDPKDGRARGNNGFQLYCQRGSLQFAANNRT